ncbi:MAG TPA: sugar ABC transporter substrate-binding protein [Armatimonadaceae bacterium]|nr:sugar ABC transporter substrate-binding protein [Armatimonadaceae bacterium]
MRQSARTTTMSRRAALSGLAGLALLLLAGCTTPAPQASPGGDTAAAGGASPAPGGKRYKIGFANLAEDIPFAVRVREGIEKAAREANLDLVTADNKLDGATALANADNFITQGVDAVIEFQTDEKFGKAIMEKFDAKNIPVIAIDIPMPGATFFGVNNPVAGKMAGEGLGKWVKANWDGKVDALIMLELPQSGPIPAARMKGQRDGLESVIGKIPEEKVKHLDSKNTLEEARKLVTDALTTLPNAKRIAIVCINDDTAQGAIAAAEAAGRQDQIAVVAIDASERGRESIRKAGSRQIGSTASFPEKYGEKIIPALVKRLNGEKLPPEIYTDHAFLTKENVDKYYPDDAK